VAYPYGQAPDQQLAASEQRYQQEFGPAPFGLFTIGLGGEQRHRYRAVNDAYCALTGYRRDELSGEDFWRDVHPDELPALRTWFEAVQASPGGGTVSADTRLIRRDGEAVCVRLAGCAVQPASGDRYLSAWVLDLTEAEQARAETRGMELELQRSRRLDSLGQLVGGIAHDFNNMLTVIANYASLVREEVSVAEAADSSTRWGPVRWDLEQIEDATDRAKRLIKHMLAFARREQTQPGPVDVGRLIQDVSGLLGEVLGEHVPVTTAHGAGLWPVEADAGLLEQAIINLALNARDAMPDGGRVTIATANIDTLAPAAAPAAHPDDLANLAELLPGHYVQIRVTDTGTGMDAMTAEHAFEPFFTTKSGDQAAGLGLAAVPRRAAGARGPGAGRPGGNARGGRRSQHGSGRGGQRQPGRRRQRQPGRRSQPAVTDRLVTQPRGPAPPRGSGRRPDGAGRRRPAAARWSGRRPGPSSTWCGSGSPRAGSAGWVARRAG
jgi:PAS domain S-box-containing protein